MTAKRVLLFGLALFVAIVAIGWATRPIGAAQAAPRQLSDRARSLISAVDPMTHPHTAGVKPQDLQCTVKVPWGLAQCGSQASSCKNCHEVQGEDPVNAKGEWHVSHAFGDFCEFCHGGNVQATDKTAAHEGLVQPLDDVKLNCSSCHAEDYQAKAEVYATALGVTVGGSGGAAQPPADTPSITDSPTPQPGAEPAAQAAPQPVTAPTLPKLASDEVVDYVAQYKAGQPQPVNTGSAVTGLLLAAVLVVGVAFVLWNEMRLRAEQQRAAASLQVITANGECSKELVELLPILEKMDTQALRGLRTFLSKRS